MEARVTSRSDAWRQVPNALSALFVVGQQDWLLCVAALTSVAASLEELWLLALLPTWRADVPGVWWLRRTG